MSNVRLSNRLSRLTPSATTALSGKVAALKAQGINVISFGAGEPDFATPDAIKAAGINAIETNQTKYTPIGGPAELRKAVAERVSADCGVTYTANQISVTNGAKEALFLAFLALCDEGDEVIIPAPYWVSYVDQAKIAGATPVIVETTPAQGFRMTASQLAAAITPRTRVLILNSPSNPTGAVYSAAELRALADVIAKHPQIVVMTDEIYDAIVYTEYARWLRVAPELYNQTLVINGASKAFAMTGWRMGFVAGPQQIIDAIKGIQSHSTSHTSSITQAAALPAYDGSVDMASEVARMVKAFRERRDIIGELLTSIPGVSLSMPDGAFYVFPDIRGLLGKPLACGVTCNTDDELAAALLEHAHIGVVSGSAFGAPGFIRMSYATSAELIREGMARFSKAVVG
ncbi:MAG: pyridoxal phosphate-dependent aminotransferase [Chloroflexota bacterium]|jgi:aspartate aminotransferase